MANPVTESAYEAVELEQWGSENLADFQQTFNKLHNVLMKRGKKVPISYQTNAGGVTRLPMRVPFRPQGGAAIQQLAAESAGNIPYFTRGTGSLTDGFAAGPVILVNTCEISNLAQWATNDKERGLVKVQKQEMEHSLLAFNNGLEGLFNSDGSGTIDSIPSSATVNNNTGSGASASSIVGLNTAAGFADQQTVQVLSAIGGTNRGSFTISYTDPVSQTIFSAGALPSGTAVGDILVVQGATGAAGSSIYGIRYWNVNGNTGTVAGINKALYPSRLSTPTINLNNTGAVTPAMAGRIEVLLSRAQGDEYSEERDSFYYCNPVQTYGMSQDFYNRGYTRLDENDSKGAEVPDTARKHLQKSYGGVELITSNSAQPTRIDRLFPQDWIIGELMETRLHDWGGGNVIAPVPAITTASATAGNATYYNSIMFAYETGLQMVCQNPKAQFYVQGAPVPVV